MVDYSKLKGILAEKNITQEQLAKKINVSIVTINRCLCGERPFKVENIIKMCKILDIEEKDIGRIFFNVKV